MKKFLISFLKTKWWRRISHNQICFFFGGQTTTGRNFAPRTKIEKKWKYIYENEVSIVGLFRKIEIPKKSYDAYFIFIYIYRIFLVFCSRWKIATGSGPAAKRNGFDCERFCIAILFSKNLLNFFFMYPSTYRNIYAKPNFNIFIHFSLIKSIKLPLISCSQGRIIP